MSTNKKSGQIGVTTENIFPIIKKFLYSDHEIFLRELVSNAVDATQKLKTLASVGEFKNELGDLNIQISIDEKKKTLTISDRGIGLTADEIEKYINQIAFSSANDFLDKYKKDANSIIGHFGLGFYSAFMVSKKVEIITRSWRDDAVAMKWECDGSPEYIMTETKKESRGTDIILHIDDENKEFLEKYRIESLLKKYCRFLPVSIAFGKKTEWKDGKSIETEEDNIINETNPLWTRKPSELTDEDYIKFYKELYPFSEDPLFWIHLNVDYPFNLTGVLYFPKVKNGIDLQKNKIQLYCNQVYVTDSVEGIVPEFLTLLHGVIDSPDIPLNVSRSYLQSDSNVKKISSYITKKVADRLEEIFKNNRPQFEEKWNSLKIFVEYGMITDEKFCERAMKFVLVENTDNKFFTLDEYKTLIDSSQTDKDKTLIHLYTSNKQEQYAYIDAAREKGYDVLVMDGQLDTHLMNTLEQKLEKCRFTRVDADVIDNLIKKNDSKEVKLSDDERNALTDLFKSVIPPVEKTDFIVGFEHLGEKGNPVTITQNEFMRRMKEMSAMQGGGMNFYGDLPLSYNMIVNLDAPVVKRVEADRENSKETISQLVDLALLSNGLLKGEALSKFIKRSIELI
ncbi:MAG: molecular chaperone HtpG [Dysgonamonadaceae bacterium]|jgi:molecular chaperone HtpG|nr:molecular chaperone HtpG [Dysgonamonadaceae bacterium]